MQGYLQIWQGLIPHWNKYYFRIHEQLLIYGPNKEEIEGRIHLKIAQIISKLDDPISLTIHTGTETIDIRAFSIDQKVKWYKKLKEVQRQSIDSAHNKELFKMRVELSKVNRFKILDDLNTELWKCHAQLQQRLEDLMDKVKNVQILKSIDRIRISVDQFKYKTSQILQYIDQEIRDLKAKDRDRSKVDSNSKRKNSNTFQQDYELEEEGYAGPEDTQFFSFYGNANKNKKEDKNRQKEREKERVEIKEKKLNKLSKIPEDSHSLSSLSIQLNKRKSRYQTPKPLRHFPSKSYISSETDLSRNRLKHKLLHQNKVYLKYSNIISPIQIRQSLPQKFTPQQKMSVITTFLTAISSGTDLTKITVPIAMNEPLSMLQNGCECMLYSDFLSKADDANDENIRMLYVTAFVVAGYSLHQFRLKRPFVPLLGQTFEFVDQQKGYEFLAEQVSQQPPISASYIRSDNYQIFDNNKSKVSFTGNGIKVTPQSKTIIKLQKQNDFYVISKCEVSLANILFGKTGVEVFGEITIKCKEFNTEVVLEFQEESFWKGTKAYKIVGQLSNQGNKLYNFQGYWNKQLLVENIATKEKTILWKKTHQVLREYYNFNELTVQLNNLTTSGYKNLSPTDSRFRPDQRALQFRDIDLASQQKQRLQQKQRKRRSDMQQQKKQHKMLWFKESVLQGEDVYISNQRYWDEKIKGMWRQSPDIF